MTRWETIVNNWANVIAKYLLKGKCPLCHFKEKASPGAYGWHLYQTHGVPKEVSKEAFGLIRKQVDSFVIAQEAVNG